MKIFKNIWSFMVFCCGGLGGILEAKRLQDEPSTAVDGNKMSPRRRQNGLRWLQVAPETRPGASKIVFISEIPKMRKNKRVLKFLGRSGRS